MKFTPTDTYTTVANSAFKRLDYSFYVKSSSSLDEALSSGSWTAVTSYVQNWSDPENTIEFNIGRFQSSVMDVAGTDISFWQDVLTDMPEKYYEFKMLCSIRNGSLSATDQVNVFAGIVDPTSLSYDDLNDSATFSVYTAQDLGDSIPVETMGVQYNYGGMLYLKQIPSMFIVNASACFYGVHTLTYKYDSSISGHVAWLDSGNHERLTIGSHYTLTAQDGVQTLGIYVSNINTLPANPPDVEYVEKFIVNNEGDALPKQFYVDASAQHILRLLYAKIGIQNLTFDDLQMPSFGGRIAYVEQVANNTTTGGVVAAALTSISGSLYVAYGNTLYSRDSQGVYTELLTVTGGCGNIVKLMHYPKFDHLWVYGQTNLNTSDGYVMRYTLSSGAKSPVTALPTATRYSTDIYYATGVGGTVYGLIYASPSTRDIKFLNGQSLTTSTILSASSFGYSFPDGPLGGAGFTIGSKHYVVVAHGTSSELWDIRYDAASPAWEAIANRNSHCLIADPYCYCPSEDRVYFADTTTTHKVRSQSLTSAAVNDVMSLDANDLVPSIVRATGNETMYFTTSVDGHLYAMSGESTFLLSDENDLSVYTRYGAFDYHNGRVYATDSYGRLYTYSTFFYPFISYADLEGETITSAINKVLKAYHMIGTVNGQKQAYVYRRSDQNGSLMSSGNYLTATVDRVTELSNVQNYTQAAQMVEVSNGQINQSYNGSAFGVRTLTGYVVSIKNNLIPNENVKDMTFYAWQFFKNNKTMYTLALGNRPLFQYEVCDGIQMDLTTNRLPASVSGVIYSVKYERDGTITVGGLV